VHLGHDRHDLGRTDVEPDEKILALACHGRASAVRGRWVSASIVPGTRIAKPFG
jgi:hypothetical protein